MKLYELEVSNYKCLNNYGIPLRFGNLNVFIGGNGAGKTSFLEVLGILLDNKKITKDVFFDTSKEIKIKIKFDNVPKEIINNAFSLEYHSFTAINYFFDIVSLEDMRKHYNDEVDSKGKTLKHFDEIIEELKSFSFYKELKNFYNSFYDNALITGIFRFSISDQEVILPEYPNFYLDYKKNAKEFANKIASNIEFISFIETYKSIIEKQSQEILSKLLNLNVLRFWVDVGEQGQYLKDYIYNDGEEIDDERKDKVINLIRSLSAQKIFQDDKIETKYSKIAKLLTTLINKENNESVLIEPEYFLDLDYLSIARHLSDTIKGLASYRDKKIHLDEYIGKGYLESYNIFNNYLLEIKDEEPPLPNISLFDVEVDKALVTSKIFGDLFQGKENLEKFVSNHIEEQLSEELNNIIKEACANYLTSLNQNDNFYYDNVRKYFKDYMFHLGEQISDFNIDFDFNKIDSGILRKIINLTVNINIKEKNKDIDITQKSLGFLRKLLISDFLILTKNLNEIMESKNAKDTILLIEEPELHLHYNAQKMIMNFIKENLSNSNSQIFITTHSHFIIENSEFENIYIFRKNKDAEFSEINNVLNFHNNTEALDELQLSLGLKKTDLLFLKKLIIIVEGKNDVAFIKGICKRPEYGINTEEILFVEAKGQANINYYIGLGDFLNIKVLVIFDYHPENFETKNRILTNPYKSAELTESLMRLEVLEKPDILNYLDLRSVEDYFNLPKNSIDLKNKNLKDILHEKGKHIRTEYVEFLASQIPKIDKELENKIINFIKLFQLT